MRKTIIFFAWCVLSVFAFTSCGGGSDDTPTPTPGSTTTNANLLKNWKASQVLEGTLDITSEFASYRIQFEDTNNEKKFTLTNRQGTSLSGTWALSTDETTLTLTFADGTTLTLNNVSISASELKYKADEQGKAGAVTLSFTLIPA